MKKRKTKRRIYVDDLPPITLMPVAVAKRLAKQIDAYKKRRKA